MKFQIPNIHHSKVNTHTHTHTDRQTDRQAESNMPFQLFQSWGHNYGVRSFARMDYRNGHHAMALGALNVFYLHKVYFCSHMNSLHKIKFITVSKIDFPGWSR